MRSNLLDVAQLVAHLVRDQEVAGSSPVIQTSKLQALRFGVFLIFAGPSAKDSNPCWATGQRNLFFARLCEKPNSFGPRNAFAHLPFMFVWCDDLKQDLRQILLLFVIRPNLAGPSAFENYFSGCPPEKPIFDGHRNALARFHSIGSLFLFHRPSAS